MQKRFFLTGRAIHDEVTSLIESGGGCVNSYEVLKELVRQLLRDGTQDVVFSRKTNSGEEVTYTLDELVAKLRHYDEIFD